MATVEMACATDIGLQRNNNQDAVVVQPALNLAVLADGMGGYKAGEVASCKAVKTVCKTIQRGEGLVDACNQANEQVYDLSNQHAEYSGMGTTLVAALYKEHKASVASVGDSRLYRFRDHKLVQLTTDQTLAQQLREQGSDYHNGKHLSAYEHVLTNAIGVDTTVEIPLYEVETQAGDVHLLCSDGLSGVLSDDEIAQILDTHAGNIKDTVRALITSGLRTSAPDNISVAVVHCN